MSIKLLKNIVEKYPARIASLGILICFAITAIATGLSQKPLATADEALHVDYAWQVYHLQLPSFYAGPILQTDFINMPEVQWTYQHPPLFYLLIAPVVGVLIATGHLASAEIAGQLINTLLGVMFIGLIGFMTYLLTKNRLSSVIAMTIASTSTMLIGVSSAVYNDLLFLILSCAAMCLTIYAMRQKELTTKLLLTIIAVCSLGLLSRSAFIVTLFFVLVAFFVKFLLPFSKSLLTKHVIQFGALLVVPLIASGWFYLKNIRESGNLLGGQSDYAHEELGRTSKDIFSVVTSIDFWSTVGSLVPSIRGILMVAVFLLLAWFVVTVSRVLTRQLKISKSLLIDWWLILILFAYIAMFAHYISIGGGQNVRYLLPALPVAVYFLSKYIAALPVHKLYSPLAITLFIVLSTGYSTYLILSSGKLFSAHYMEAITVHHLEYIVTIISFVAIVLLLSSFVLLYFGTARLMQPSRSASKWLRKSLKN